MPLVSGTDRTWPGFKTYSIFYGIVFLVLRKTVLSGKPQNQRLTMRKQVPKIMAFTFTSMSSGKWMSKWSASSIADNKPFHFLMILPMLDTPSRDWTWSDKDVSSRELKGIKAHGLDISAAAVCTETAHIQCRKEYN